VHLALSGATEGNSYDLKDATFVLTQDGSTEPVTVLTSDSSGDTLSAALPAGDYDVTLENGWSLALATPEGGVNVMATLVSDNPASFTIAPDETTEVTFTFQTEGMTVGIGLGKLELGIAVETLTARRVIFSELMKNPNAVPDTDGEWLELTNTGTESVSLQGCVVGRDMTQFTINAPLNVAPGESVTLANGEQPGFAPSYVYGSVSLPNSAAFDVSLTCGAEVLDVVHVDPASVPNASGASLSLDAAVRSASENDATSAWCDGATDYNAGDLGTPGTANPSCG
jgi:hypothetical protein